jgi:MFS transporter, NNP family, nitrate/nitrite transporter
VATAFWTSSMFTNEIVGSANALAAGWGNLGAGVTYLLTPFLFDLVTSGSAVTDDWGWRITLLFPAVCMVVVGVCLYHFADDCPHGNYSDIKKLYGLGDRLRAPQTTSLQTAMWSVSKKPVVWILAFHYACSFGVEIQVHNVLSLYYYEDFTRAGCDLSTHHCRLLSQTTAGVISSLFGLMCIFARAAGGYASDVASRRWQMQGRVGVQCFILAGEAASLLVFSRITSLGMSIPWLIVFGVLVQACTGSTYGIVPYVAPGHTGITSGIVGAGGNAGALAWGFLFKATASRADAFMLISGFVAAATLLCGAVYVDGEGSLWRNEPPGRETAVCCDERRHEERGDDPRCVQL